MKLDNDTKRRRLPKKDKTKMKKTKIKKENTNLKSTPAVVYMHLNLMMKLEEYLTVQQLP